MNQFELLFLKVLTIIDWVAFFAKLLNNSSSGEFSILLRCLSFFFFFLSLFDLELGLSSTPSLLVVSFSSSETICMSTLASYADTLTFYTVIILSPLLTLLLWLFALWTSFWCFILGSFDPLDSKLKCLFLDGGVSNSPSSLSLDLDHFSLPVLSWLSQG